MESVQAATTPTAVEPLVPAHTASAVAAADYWHSVLGWETVLGRRCQDMSAGNAAAAEGSASAIEHFVERIVVAAQDSASGVGVGSVAEDSDTVPAGFEFVVGIAEAHAAGEQDFEPGMGSAFPETFPAYQ